MPISKKAALVAVFVIVLVAGTGFFIYLSMTPSATIKSFELTAFEFGYNGVKGGPTIKVKVGDTVRITLMNQGGIEHELMIVEKVEMPMVQGRMAHPEPVFAQASIEDVRPGQTKAATFKVTKPGRFFYACFEEEPEPHYKLGMFGEFIAES